ncbi:MAG: lysophospholipase, partial [Acidimicrobiia bacterium]|nr:lysophospholipase [Acidimicrobiia bacterium]
LAGAVLLAGPARNGKEILRWQARQIGPTLPKPVKFLMKLLRQDIEKTQMKRLGKIEASTTDTMRIQFVKVNAKWFREFLAHEPLTALQKAATPILAITGSKDIQVDPADVALMEEAVPTEFTGHVVEDLTHLLREETGPASIRTYKKQAKRPIDNRVAELVTSWISTHSPTNADQV